MKINRIKQVLQALTAQIETADYLFLEKWLAPDEKELFFAMSLPEQRHALNVAYSARRLSWRIANVNQELLLRSALLHDVGKIYGDMSIFDKIIAVLADAFVPQKARSWARFGREEGWLQNVRHALYIYFSHAELGRDKLLALGLTEIAAIVAQHHKAPAENDPPELLLLRKADELN